MTCEVIDPLGGLAFIVNERRLYYSGFDVVMDALKSFEMRKIISVLDRFLNVMKIV